VIEIPGFGRRRLGAVLFYVVALPLGLIWGARAKAFVSLQLMSTTTCAAVCSLLLRRPFVALATTSNELGELRYLRSTRLGPVRLRLLQRAAFLLAQTPEVAAELRGVAAEERVGLLPNPVVLPVNTPGLSGEPRALYAGRLSAEKDLLSLLDAWRTVLEERPEAALTLAGSGGAFRSVEADVRAAVERDPALRRTVTLTGWVDRVEPYYEESDVFVLPSREEGMSNALLEACAFGRIAVASNIPANRAVLGEDYPLLFAPGDSAALAAALRHALDPRDALRDEARERVVKRIRQFSVDSVVEQLESMIDAADSSRH
jgi:glycosyltransferase involved in cell wall biosynthesis